MFRVIIGMPAYNEDKNLQELLARLYRVQLSASLNLEIFVVNDGSTDQTAAILNRAQKAGRIKYLSHLHNSGLGSALQSIFDYAQGFADEDVLVTLDADNTQGPEIIPELVKRLKTEKLDLVVASRFTPGGKEIGLSPLRKLYSRGAMLFFKLFFPIKGVRDYSCGYRAYNLGYLKRALKLYEDKLITDNSFSCSAEIMARFQRIGIQAREYPLTLEYNLKKGQSKMNVVKTIAGYFRLLVTVRKPLEERRSWYGGFKNYSALGFSGIHWPSGIKNGFQQGGQANPLLKNPLK